MHKIFPSADTTMVAVALGLSNAIGFMGAVFNGVFPGIPLGPQDFWAFIVVSFLGLTAANSIALQLTLDKQKLNLISAILISGSMNLGLVILLGAPCFYTLLSVSNMLFK